MIRRFSHVARYSRAWSRGTDAVRAVETHYTLDGVDVPGTLYLPPSTDEPLPAWVVLHGVTVPGRKHATLVRFARAVAAARAIVFTPEIPAWTALRLDPSLAIPCIEAAVLALSQCPGADPSRTGLLGFSFGAPQALVASAQPQLRGRLKTVVGFGGYSDLHRILGFLFTGLHDWEGKQYSARPDPYGRWIVGANFLTSAQGFESAAPLAQTLHALATAAGKRQIASWDPVYDGYKQELRQQLPSELRATYDLFAPPAGVRPDIGRATDLVDRLHEAMVRTAPAIDPGRWTDRVIRPVHLLHGRHDPLIPFTESLRMAARLREHGSTTDVFDTVTPLFAHSSEGGGIGVIERAWEGFVLARALGRVFDSV